MNERRLRRNDISSVKAMTDQEYCSCLQGCYQPAPELQTDMRNFLPCCQFQARNRGRIRKCQGGRSFIHGQQTQTGLPTQLPVPMPTLLGGSATKWSLRQDAHDRAFNIMKQICQGAGNGATVLPLLDCLQYRTAPEAGHSTLATAKLVSIATFTYSCHAPWGNGRSKILWPPKEQKKW